MSNVPWWKSAVVYQIYPRSFADGNGDGVGDLPGLTARLDHLEWLGVDAIWLSPFYPSPMRDFGYDVSDYCDVDPVFGTLADFDAMLAEAHSRDIRLIIDWVPAHTSSDHPWFQEARSSRSNPRRDWYVWRDPGPNGELPNNWIAAFTQAPAWTLDEGSGQLYLHSFLPGQPDLNWENPDLRGAMHDVLRFWLDRGVDGFRADVVHNIGKLPGLPDAPEDRAKLPHCILNDAPATHEYLREVRRVLDGYPGDRMMVGEVVLLTIEQLPPYYGTPEAPELHLSFNFVPLRQPWDAGRWRGFLEKTLAAFEPAGAWPTWVLSNHDVPRHRTRYSRDGGDAEARAAAVLLLTLWGTPFLYMGEELGLEDAEVPEERIVDPGGRDGCRAPLPWDGSSEHGWGADAWLPFPPQADLRNVASLRADPESILHFYRRLLTARRASPALQVGEIELLETPEGVLAWRRSSGADVRTVVVNLRPEPAAVDLVGKLQVEIASDGRGEGAAFSGETGPNQALILR